MYADNTLKFFSNNTTNTTKHMTKNPTVLDSMTFCQTIGIDQKYYYFAPPQKYIAQLVNEEKEEEVCKLLTEIEEMYASIPNIFLAEGREETISDDEEDMPVIYNMAKAQISTNIPQKNYFFITPCLTEEGLVIHKIHIKGTDIQTTHKTITRKNYVRHFVNEPIITKLTKIENFASLSTWEVMEKMPLYFGKINLATNIFASELIPIRYFVYLGYMPPRIIENYLEYILIPKIDKVTQEDSLSDLGYKVLNALDSGSKVNLLRTNLTFLRTGMQEKAFYLTLCPFQKNNPNKILHYPVKNDVSYDFLTAEDKAKLPPPKDDIQSFITSNPLLFAEEPLKKSPLLKITDLWKINPKLKALQQEFYSPKEFKNIWPYAHQIAQLVFNTPFNKQQTNTPSDTENSYPPKPK